MFIEILFSLLYTVLFIWFIYKWHFFRFEGIHTIELSIIFVVKVLAGISLTLIYTYYYTNRSEADIFKFFDDSAYIFNALFINPVHYLQLVFGIHSDAHYLQPYLEGTQYWAVQTEAYQEFTATENVNFFNAHRFITRFNAVVRLFSFGYFSVHTIFMCFLSLCGLTALYKTFYPQLKNKRNWLIAGVFFMPSVIFWSSGVLKEGFIFFTLGFFIYAYFKLLENNIKISSLIIFLLSGLLLLYIKYYILMSLLPVMAAYFLALKLNTKLTIFPYLIIYGLIVIYIFIAPYSKGYLPNPLKILADKQSELIKEASGGTYCIRNDGNTKEIVFFKPETILKKTVIDSARHLFTIQPGIIAYKYDNGNVIGDSILITKENLQNTYFYEILSKPRAGSYIIIPILKPYFTSFLKALPTALINVFVRPHMFEINSLLNLPASLENMFILIFLIFAIIRFKSKNEDTNTILFLFFSVFTLYIITGLTTPVLGNIVRYKSVFLPFLIIMALLLISSEKRGKIQ